MPALNHTVLQARFRLQQFIRTHLADRQFIEIDTPIIVPTPGTEKFLRYFPTRYSDIQGKERQLFLRSSPELHLKQALSQGFERVFHMGKCFRNGGERGPWHHPEFTMLEWYQVGVSYTDFMTQTEELVKALAKKVSPHYPAAKNFTTGAFKRLSVAQAFQQYAHIDLQDQDPQLAVQAIQQGIASVRADDDFETAFFKILLERIEPELQRLQAVFLYDYPASQAALARVEGPVAKRFELYLNGVEICNAFWELADRSENARRFAHTDAFRKEQHWETPAYDPYFDQALVQGLPNCCGNALGVDRLIAVLMGEENLDRVIPFRAQF